MPLATLSTLYRGLEYVFDSDDTDEEAVTYTECSDKKEERLRGGAIHVFWKYLASTPPAPLALAG
jgi:Zn/Cd-binding protein ZinT